MKRPVPGTRLRIETERGRFAEAPLHRSRYRLVVVNLNDFSLVGPILGPLNQSGSHRILPHVFPFLRVTLRIANDVIKETTLPNF